MEIRKDSAVTIEYSVRLEDGSFVKGDREKLASMNFVAGYDQLMPALEHRLYGLKEGDVADFVIPFGEAFGPYRKDLVKFKSFEEFPDGVTLEVGKWVLATNPATNAQYSYKVIGKKDNGLMIDFNHPLAGQNLYYHVKIVKVRPATEEELKFLRPCEFQTKQT